MRIAENGVNYAILRNVDKFPQPAENERKFHLIKLELEDPTEEDMIKIFDAYPDTKRYIINRYIRFYNKVFKKELNKKFYVENRLDDNILVHMKKHNKIAVNLSNMKDMEFKLFVDDLYLVLNYVEVVIASKESWKKLYDYKGEDITEEVLRTWAGNVILE